jgi:acyl-CoA synthetase (NDP forming)
MQIDRIQSIVQKVFESGRRILLENEVYTLLKLAGFPVPIHDVIAPGRSVDSDFLQSFPGDKLVLKVLSPFVLHKSDVGGVRIVDKTPEAVNAAVEAMLGQLPEAFFTWNQKKKQTLDAALSDEATQTAVFEAAVAGVLVAEFVPYKSDFGGELLLGARHSREFASVMTFGIGGTDAEFFAEALDAGRGHAIRSTALLDRASALDMLKQTAVYDRLSGNTRGTKARLEDSLLLDAIEAFRDLVNCFSAGNESAPCLLEELEINPLVITEDGCLVPLDGLMRLTERPAKPLAKPLGKIENLLDAESIALVGVSKKMNPARIILQNLLDKDFPKDRIYILKPGEEELAGVRCYPTAASLPEKVDLLVLAVSAAQVPDMLEAVCEADCAQSVIVIPGGIAEKEGGEVIQQRIDQVMAKARSLPSQGPVISGSNCLGLYARDAGVNTLFIPEYKLPRPHDSAKSRVAYLSQSGAFMICRMSRITDVDPVYAVSYGNQMDLTIGDFIEHLLEHEGIDLLACYVEGFGDLDGLKVARLAARARELGKKILLYKAGRTVEGQSASAGHTASIAGDYETCRQVLSAAGVELLEVFEDFETRVRLSQNFSSDTAPARIPRIGVISNAGFECVGIADNLKRKVFGQQAELQLAKLSTDSGARLLDIFKAARLDTLVDVKNPLDLTPMANDQIWADCVQVLLEDPDVDAAIVSIVPLTAAMKTLASADHHKEDLTSEAGIVSLLKRLKQTTQKPFVVAIDSGRLYDPMVRALEGLAIPVFAFSDQATRYLAKALS